MFYVPTLPSVFVHITHFHTVSAKDKMCKSAEPLGLKWKTGIKTHTHTRTRNERERRNEGESALSHLWICHFATTVSVTFAKARNKVCVGMCVFMCIGRAWLWVCTCSVCALTYSDQISIIVCSRCYRVWDHACFLFPGFSLVCSPPSQDLCSTLNWLKMTR